MTFHIKDENFYLNNQKVFLNSGEIHYFRIKRELWDTHLSAAKEAGLSTVSTYVPWAWHESVEGTFDFDGKSSPERDLNEWLRKCQKHGLYCILKPGPFILAEFRGAGLPDWFIEKYEDEVKMRNRRGEKVPSDGVSLFNKIYIEKVTRWYDQIMPFISKRQVSAGGPVIMMQICNEIGVFSWLAHQADYGGDIKKRFVLYLQKRYADIMEINGLWETSYRSFDDIELPPDGREPYASKGDRGRDIEWHAFWRTLYGDYLRMLVKMARERGVTVPMYHNLPGWIYGHGYEFPVNITMYDDLYGDKSDIVFGVDHIPEFMSYRNMHDDRIINDITRAMQGKKPLFAAEFQSGSREYHVVTNPREMELFYKASIANGLTGWNYYMFSQGRNPSRKGYSGETFYWFNPLTAEGARTSAFTLVKRINGLVKTCENLIVEAKRKAEVCVLFYPHYYATELERPETGASDLRFVPAVIRRSAFFDGLLKVLQILNIDYDMADLSKISAKELGIYKQVWVFSTDEMEARDQQVVVDYVNIGGNAALFPYLPEREMSQKPCTIIRDALGISPAGTESIDSPLVDILNYRDIKCANPQIIYTAKSLVGAEIIAKTLKGSVCGFVKTVGKGSVLHLGFWLGYDTEGHKPVYETLLNKLGGTLRHSSASNDNISVRQRFTDAQESILFIGNYFNEEQTGRVTYTHPESQEQINIPYTGNEMLWPPLYATLTPVCLKITDGIKILHTTSDIVNIDNLHEHIDITLSGDRDLQGEMVLEGIKIDSIKSISFNDEVAITERHSKRIVISYKHLHKKEFKLKITLS